MDSRNQIITVTETTTVQPKWGSFTRLPSPGQKLVFSLSQLNPRGNLTGRKMDELMTSEVSLPDCLAQEPGTTSWLWGWMGHS